MTYDAVIIGGGVAGCSAAIQMAGEGHRVLLLEKKRYPSYKLCGEFLSVEVLGMFERLGVREAVWQAGARPIDHTVITTTDGEPWARARIRYEQREESSAFWDALVVRLDWDGVEPFDEKGTQGDPDFDTSWWRSERRLPSSG